MAIEKRPEYDPFSAVREMLNTDKINTKTDLDLRQIRNITDSRTLCYMFDSKLGDRHVSDFMETTLSKDRKSRFEVMESVKTAITNAIEKIKFSLTG